MVSSRQAKPAAVRTWNAGRIRRWKRSYTAGSRRSRAWVRKLLRRPGEVILVLPRPAGRYLVHTKSIYPQGLYRLPGGGIKAGEAVLDAARREAFEETGFKLASLRLIGVVQNLFRVDGAELEYKSFITLAPLTKQKPHVIDPHEAISGFREETLEGLVQVARALRELPSAWQPWGSFRAAPHLLVVQVLANLHGARPQD